MKDHYYRLDLRWTGNKGSGTSAYKEYGREHVIHGEGKSSVSCSADPQFRGDPAKWNPEELLVASVANCHLLWYLHLCADAGVTVQAYEDSPEGVLSMDPDGSGAFRHITLRPKVKIAADSDPELALALHRRAHEMCFIARSLRCPVRHEPTVVMTEET